ncbi:unnamed protein product [Clavelina lepadiformis]|uniref:NACHT domain-containing protein n=1 Tax=Clavelina lepadiformis TaxID=159417 RepID=A0ABP0GFK2_CLALP
MELSSENNSSSITRHGFEGTHSHNNENEDPINIHKSSVHIGDTNVDQSQHSTQYHVQNDRSCKIDLRSMNYTDDRTMHYHDNRATHYHMELNSSSYETVPENSTNHSVQRNDSEELFHRLEDVLMNSAKLVAYRSMEWPIDFDGDVEAVPLEITPYPPHPASAGDLEHFHRRKTAHPCDYASLNPKQIFSAAKQSAQQEAYRKFRNETDQGNFICTHGNVVGVIGQAGIGKTTLTKLLTKAILEGDLDIQAQYIFHIAFRNVDFTVEFNLLELLLMSSLCEWEHDDESDFKILHHLNQCENLVLIFDGFDEAAINHPKRLAPNVSLTRRSTAETLIKNILSGRLLPRAKKLVTSRPRQLYELHPCYIPRFLVSILGLTEASQKKLCLKICGDVSSQVMQYLDANPDVNAHCYVPVNCILTMHCIYSNIQDGEGSSLKSITSVMTYALDGFVRSEHMHGHESEVAKLADLAWNGFKQQKIIFSEADLAEVDISSKTLHSFLNTFVDSHVGLKILEGDKESYFSHLIWQEFFVAVKMIYFMVPTELQLWFHKFGESRFEVVSKFAYGICAKETSKRLRKIFPLVSESHLTNRKEMLKEFLLECTPVSFENMATRYLRVCGWLKEANLTDFNHAVSHAMPSTICLSCDLLPSDAVNLHYHFCSTRVQWFLKLELSRCSGGSLYRLFREIAATIQRHNVKIMLVSLSSLSISEQDIEALCRCLPIISRLSLSKTVVASQQIVNLAQSIRSLERPLEMLLLRNIELDDETARDFALSVRNIRKLKMHGVELSSVGMEYLSNAITLLSEPLDYLEISNKTFHCDETLCLTKCLQNVKSFSLNKWKMSPNEFRVLTEEINAFTRPLEKIQLVDPLFGNGIDIALSKCIHKIRNIFLHNCNVTGTGMEFLSGAIRILSYPLVTLELKGNNFGERGTSSLSSCIHNILKLSIRDCGLSEQAIVPLSTAIAALEQPMKYLDLSLNKLGDFGAVCLSKCIHKLKILNLSRCEITEVGVEALSKAVQKVSTPLHEMNLSENMFGDAGALLLSPCLLNLKRLDVSNCAIKEVGMGAISNTITNLSHPMEYLNASFNNELGDGGIAALSQCLHKLRKLHICHCNITSAGIKLLSEAMMIGSAQPVRKMLQNSINVGRGILEVLYF